MKVICAVRDRAVDAFGVPFFCHHVNEAIRSFKTEVNRDGSIFKDHPDDYDLYELGRYDDQTGSVVPSDRPSMLATGKSMVNAE